MKYILLTYSIFLFSPLLGQKRLVGTLTDKEGKPVAFANVCDTLGHGAMSNQSGCFFINITKKLPQVIIASAVGYEADTFKVTANNSTYCLKHKQYDLNEVTVKGLQSIERKSAVSAFTTKKQEINILRPKNVCGILQNSAGFTNRSGYQTPLTLRGLTGKRLLVLRNGMRRFSSYPSGFVSHVINVYDLERIEVEKGPASVVYGAGAMAGIINLIDKSPFKQKGLNAKFTTGYGSVNSEKNILACGGWSNGKIALKSGVRYRTAGNFTYPDKTTAENSFYTDKDLFVTAGYKFSEKQNLIFTADIHRGGPWGKPVGFNGSKFMKVQTHNENSNNFSLKYSLISDGIFQNTEANIFYSNEGRKLIKNYYTVAGYMLSYTETTDFSDYYYGTNVNTLLHFSDYCSIKTGAEMFLFNISTPVDGTDYIEEVSFANRVSHNAHSQTSGVFFEPRFRVTPKLKIKLGLRYNYASINEGNAYVAEGEPIRELYKSAFSGNFATMYNLSKKSTLKLNLARSFRMPETTELFTDNYTSNGIIYANPELLPEYCNSLDVSFQFRGKRLEVEASPFIWLMDNMITKEEIKGMPGTNFTYVNIGKTRLFGGEINSKLNFEKPFAKNDNLSVRVGIAYLNGTDVTETSGYWSSTGVPLNYVPPFNLKSNVNYHTVAGKNVKLNFVFRTTYYTKQTRLGNDPYATPAFWLFGCNAGIALPKSQMKPSLNLAINNLANAEYYCYQSYLPSEGRDIRVFLTLNF